MQVTYVDHCGSDLSVVNAARVSFAKESNEFSDKDSRLITYLAKHKHLSPFNHSFLSYRVKAPIFVARQLVKHEYMPWNEVSRRYVDEDPDFYIPPVFREKAEDKKQGSGGALKHSQVLVEMSVAECEKALEYYRHCLYNDVCEEQARMFLPLNTYTEWVWSGTLGAFAKMLSLRLASDTQYETQLIAKKIYADAKERFPVSLNALLKETYNIDEECLYD